MNMTRVEARGRPEMSMEKYLKWSQKGPGVFSPTNPDLADILGDMNFDYENVRFVDLFGSQSSKFPGSQNSRNLAWARLGPRPSGCRAKGLGWAGLGP